MSCGRELRDVEELVNSLDVHCAALDEQTKLQEATANLAESEAAAAEVEHVSSMSRINSVREESKAAQDQVMAITKAQLNEVKVLKSNPPVVVRRSLELVWLILNCRQWTSGEGTLQGLDLSQKWPNIQRMLVNEAFLHKVVEFDPVELETTPWVVDYVTSHFLLLDDPMISTRPGTPPSVPVTPKATAQPATSNPLQGRSCRSSSRTQSGTLGSPGPPSTLRSAGLSAVRARSSQVAKPSLLDLNTVEHASRACAVLVRWCSRVVREFTILRDLSKDCAEAKRRSEAMAGEAALARDAAAACRAKLEAAMAERDAARTRLAELRLEAEKAEKALSDLAKLQQLQEQLEAQSAAPAEPLATPGPPAKEQAPLRIPPPQSRHSVEEPPGPNDTAIVLDLSPPHPLPERGLAGTATMEEEWWVEFAWNKADIGGRRTAADRDQETHCLGLSRHLSEHPETVVLLTGYSSGADEDDGLPARRAQGLAQWLVQNGAHWSQLRFSLPPWPGKASSAQAAPEGVRKEEHGALEEETEGPEEEVEEEEEEEEEATQDEDVPETPPLPLRRVTVTPLREVRIKEGPRAGDAAQSEHPGLFFAPEDADLDSLGTAAQLILERLAEEVRCMLRSEQSGGRLLIEGHADEGIEDEELLRWLGQQRAESVREFLLHVGGARGQDPGEGGLQGEEGGAASQTRGVEECSYSLQPSEVLTKATDQRSQSPPPLTEREMLAFSRGRECRRTVEWGRRGLNRRVQIFIL